MLGAPRDVAVVNLNNLTYAGNLENLQDLEGHARYRFARADICDADAVAPLVRNAEAVVNFDAESQVDRSIESDYPFIHTNVLRVQTLLAACVASGGRRFIQISADEVYGQLPWRAPNVAVPDQQVPRFRRDRCLAPRSPYAASKAASDYLVLAYFHTHGLDVAITRSCNNYGPYQFPEKLIPMVITNLLEGKGVPTLCDLQRSVHASYHVTNE